MTRNIKSLLEKKPGFVCSGSANAFEISKAEQALSLTFSEDFKEYTAGLGIASFEGHELTGVGSIDRLNVVHVTMQERELDNSIPKDWYVIEQSHIDGIVFWQDATGAVYKTQPNTEPINICNSLEEYIND